MESSLSQPKDSDFRAPNWQLLTRAADQCSVNSRYWAFASALTGAHYEISVFDTVAFQAKKYFFYPGAPPAPIQDTNAFATCP